MFAIAGCSTGHPIRRGLYSCRSEGIDPGCGARRHERRDDRNQARIAAAPLITSAWYHSTPKSI
jgi:hypothetical protein